LNEHEECEEVWADDTEQSAFNNEDVSPSFRRGETVLGEDCRVTVVDQVTLIEIVKADILVLPVLQEIRARSAE
jgi:hypothetical protein